MLDWEGAGHVKRMIYRKTLRSPGTWEKIHVAVDNGPGRAGRQAGSELNVLQTTMASLGLFGIISSKAEDFTPDFLISKLCFSS